MIRSFEYRFPGVKARGDAPRLAVACLVALFLSVVAGVLAFLAWCFQYVIWSLFARDLPWYVDVLGGGVTNGFIAVAAFACWVLQLVGYAVPFIK